MTNAGELTTSQCSAILILRFFLILNKNLPTLKVGPHLTFEEPQILFVHHLSILKT